MGKKDKRDRTGTYTVSNEVMDEMENLEATAEIAGLEGLPQDDDATAVIKVPRPRKATGGDSA